MDQKEINKQRRCSYLLPPPGGEVVRALLDEIEKLQTNPAECDARYCHVADIEFGKAFIIPEVGQVYIRLDPNSRSDVQCIQIVPSVDFAMLVRDIRVCPVDLKISWSPIK